MAVDDGLWGPHGERLSGAHSRVTEVRGRTLGGGLVNPALGLVVARYYKDEEDNRRGQFTEYDVYLPKYQITLRNIPIKNTFQGFAGGSEVTLTPAAPPDMTDGVNAWQSIMDSEGDLVSVVWVGDRFPVIDGCMNHIRAGADGAPWHGDSTDGAISRFTYNTTSIKVDSDGNISIDLDDTAAPPDRELIINAGSKQLLKISYDDGAGEVRLELGSGVSLEKILCGESFQSWWDTYVKDHVHPAGTLTDSTPAPVTGATGGAIIALPNSLLTEKVKAEK